MYLLFKNRTTQLRTGYPVPNSEEIERQQGLTQDLDLTAYP